MRGERNLAGTVRQVGEAFGLSGESLEYFEELVAFDQADGHTARSACFERIAAIRRFRHAHRLEDGLFIYLSRWYYPAVRELVASCEFQEDSEWIAQTLVPKITPREASEALAALEELGLLARDATGRLVRGEVSVTTGHEVRALGVANYHREMLKRASESMELFPSSVRDLAAMTVCIAPETASELKARIHAFRELIFERCEQDEAPRTLYQFNTQLFPMSQLNEGGDP